LLIIQTDNWFKNWDIFHKPSPFSKMKATLPLATMEAPHVEENEIELETGAGFFLVSCITLVVGLCGWRGTVTLDSI